MQHETEIAIMAPNRTTRQQRLVDIAILDTNIDRLINEKEILYKQYQDKLVQITVKVMELTNLKQKLND
jgi:hypothetical protein